MENQPQAKKKKHPIFKKYYSSNWFDKLTEVAGENQSGLTGCCFLKKGCFFSFIIKNTYKVKKFSQLIKKDAPKIIPLAPKIKKDAPKMKKDAPKVKKGQVCHNGAPSLTN